jgi:capsular polysaccharide export protein
MSNLDLLRAARERHPEALIVYKPHPDVEAGFRRGRIPLKLAQMYADRIAANTGIIDLIQACDRLETITSLAGFEALLRGKPVTTHGQPFYAGWGLTEDLCPVPRRRGTRSLDELVAAALILYPRYLDPCQRDCQAARSSWSTASRPRSEIARPGATAPCARPEQRRRGSSLSRGRSEAWDHHGRQGRN